MKEKYKINLAHTNELNSQYIRSISVKRFGWKVISSVSNDNGNALILWENPSGIWIEERGYVNGEEKKIRNTRLISPACIAEAVGKLTSGRLGEEQL